MTRLEQTLLLLLCALLNLIHHEANQTDKGPATQQLARHLAQILEHHLQLALLKQNQTRQKPDNHAKAKINADHLVGRDPANSAHNLKKNHAFLNLPLTSCLASREVRMQVRFGYLPYVALLAFCAGRMSNQVSEADPAATQASGDAALTIALSSEQAKITGEETSITKAGSPTSTAGKTAQPSEAKRLAAALRVEQAEKQRLANELAKTKQLIAEREEAELIAAHFIEDVAHDPIQWSLQIQSST